MSKPIASTDVAERPAASRDSALRMPPLKMVLLGLEVAPATEPAGSADGDLDRETVVRRIIARLKKDS